jgi:glycosyltransferase involved in cell wall biosynthesis/SAM-dependent methyltransferase
VSIPRVSVVMIFLDAEAFIAEAIASVEAQSCTDWELLLVDDGSSDGSTGMARDAAKRIPERIRYLEHPGHHNRGMSASRNLGFSAARGEFIALLDADDVWQPGRLAHHLDILERTPAAAMVFGPTRYWHAWTGDPDHAPRDHVPELGVPPGTVFAPPVLARRLYPLGSGPAPCLCAITVRTDAVHAVGGFEESFTGFYEDQAFLSKMYLRHPIVATEECHDWYRIHPRSCSAVTASQGEYRRHRDRFLLWLEDYMDRGQIEDPKLRELLRVATDRRNAAADEHGGRPLRLLRVANGGEAHLTFPPENPDLVRIEIATPSPTADYDIQLSYPRYPLVAGTRYHLSCLMRADAERSVGIGVSLAHAPWTNAGFYQHEIVGPTWRHVSQEFTSSLTDENARVHFDVGTEPASVEVSGVLLRTLDEGRTIRPGTTGTGTTAAATERDVDPGDVQFGMFRRLTPISHDFGYERGQPVDRHYIEGFLAGCAADVQGRVLEIGDRTYTRRYGKDRVTGSDMMHVTPGEPEATIIGDMATADHIPSDTFDCIIFTQTLQLIYDFHSAIRHLHRILKPGGVLLITFPGISQTYDTEWGSNWCWAFTPVSARRMFGDVFGPASTHVESHGNVLAAIAFLHGLTAEELTAEELAYHEAGYAVTVAVRAVKS